MFKLFLIAAVLALAAAAPQPAPAPQPKAGPSPNLYYAASAPLVYNTAPVYSAYSYPSYSAVPYAYSGGYYVV